MNNDEKKKLEELSIRGEEYCNTELESLVQKLFSDYPALEIFKLLEEIGSSSRVKLAVVQLSEGNIAKLKELVAAAKRDYRDVLLWAEYPTDAKKARELLVCLGNWLIDQGNESVGKDLLKAGDGVVIDDIEK